MYVSFCAFGETLMKSSILFCGPFHFSKFQEPNVLSSSGGFCSLVCVVLSRFRTQFTCILAVSTGDDHEQCDEQAFRLNLLVGSCMFFHRDDGVLLCVSTELASSAIIIWICLAVLRSSWNPSCLSLSD